MTLSAGIATWCGHSRFTRPRLISPLRRMPVSIGPRPEGAARQSVTLCAAPASGMVDRRAWPKSALSRLRLPLAHRDRYFLIGSRSFLSISLDAVRPYEQNQGRDTMTTQDTTRRVIEGYFAAWTAKKVNEAYALVQALLLSAAAL